MQLQEGLNMDDIDIKLLPIRLFKPEDEDKVKLFFDELGGEARAFFNRNDGNRNGAMTFFRGEDKSTLRWLVLHEQRMVGYLFLWELDKSIPWLGIAIADDFRGRRLGRRLMEFAEDYVRKNGYGGILLTTHVSNLRGQGLYERTGYQRLGYYLDGEVLYLRRFGH